MKIHQILKNSSYNLDFFKAHSLQSLENRIIDKANGGGQITLQMQIMP